MSDDHWEKARAREAETLRIAQAALGRRPVGLKDQRNWFEKQAADKTIPLRERELWQRLADEVTERLGDRREDEQDTLF